MRKLAMTVLMAAAAACSGSASIAHDVDDERTVEQGPLEQRSFDLAGFDGVSVVGPHKVTIVVGPAFSIRAEGSAATFEKTEVYVEDGVLRIEPEHVRQRDYERNWWRDYEGANFTVTLPRLEAASNVGSGRMTVDRVEGDDFAASVAGSGELDIASLAVNEANLSVAGSGDLVVRGTAREANLSIAGSGNMRTRELTSDEAAISIAGSGDAVLTVNGDAHVSIVGSGDVEIAGSARCSVSRMGSGKVRCAEIEHETEFSFR